MDLSNPLDKILLVVIILYILHKSDIFFPIQIQVLKFYGKFQKKEEEELNFTKILEKLEEETDVD